MKTLSYGVGDALALLGMLRCLEPRHYLEVGGGFTTGLTVDVNERCLGGHLSITAIEPYPELLKTLIRPADRIKILNCPVQSVPLEYLARLEANDVLFIDSSHMLKIASDVQYLFTAILPILAEDVYIHFHDIFWPCEYPRAWIEMGIAWNEAYLLDAFLLLTKCSR